MTDIKPDTSSPQPMSEASSGPCNGARRRRVRQLLLLLGPLLMALVGTYLYLFGGRYISTENAYVKSDKVAISAQVRGPITQVLVSENAHVAAGAVLFHIDPRPFQIALARSEAELQRVRAEVRGLQISYGQQQQELTLAREDLDFAEREYRRQVGLAKHKVASQTRLDQAQRGLVAAKQKLVVIQEAIEKLRARLGGDPDLGVTQQPLVKQAQAARDQAALDLENTTIRAPFAGVASNAPEPGQYVEAARPVMSIVSDQRRWIEANFKETDLTFVQPGQAVTIEVDAYPNHLWHGTVASISPATGAEFSVLPAQNTTGNWVKVVQRIPVRITVVPGDADTPLRAGMSSWVEIDTGTRPLPGPLHRALAWLGIDAGIAG